MKTLILNGSPRKNGDTESLVNLVSGNLKSDYMIINAYTCNISPCIDCRFCWKDEGCVIQDEMQEVYAYIQECDNILIASPIYFSELTGKLLDVGSRFQTYFCGGFFRKEIPIKKPKRGAVILVGGGDGNMNKAYETACVLLHHINCYDIHSMVSCHNTNHVSAMKDKQTLAGVESIIQFFNSTDRK